MVQAGEGKTKFTRSPNAQGLSGLCSDPQFDHNKDLIISINPGYADLKYVPLSQLDFNVEKARNSNN